MKCLRNKHLTNIIRKNFTLYIPKKKLDFDLHPYYGRVYTVYLADKEQYNDKRTKWIGRSLIFLSSMNLYFFLTNVGLIPVIYNINVLTNSAYLIMFSLMSNMYFIREYLRIMSDSINNIKSMYLLPSGKKIIIERFNGEIELLDNLDIFDNNIFCKYDQKVRKLKFWDNNHNSFKAVMHYGRNKQFIISGKKVIFDYDIFFYIVNKHNIDTDSIAYRSEIDDIQFNKEFKDKYKHTVDYVKKRTIIKSITFDQIKKRYIRYISNFSQQRERALKWFYN